ncbi:hypothetical protein BT96DRAFT_966292 [Gymnopus androsaceus JB14]|uniref:FAD-binding FR-type domain-containing protein n=1 Tax=Gymnopus androsaceus JB14 TaxID=1447944 RepID=A0A6A4HHH4_9AGAR|nr:hypothetical protein BT96DRAFT_966292 [Gymnopus androsaceus JB14]
MALNGWHVGEREIHRKMNYLGDPAVQSMFTWVSDEIDPGYAQFHAQCHFLPVTTLDSTGRPWGSILAPQGGETGSKFIRYIGGSRLRVTAEIWEGEPIIRTGKKNMLVAGIGIHFPTRMRNKIAGYATGYTLSQGDRLLELDMRVNETIGNCPKYINIRKFTPHPNSHPKVAAENLDLKEGERLPENLIDFILESDTVFFGTTYVAPAKDADMFPSHLGMNQRGGRKGFIRVSRKDGRTLAMPDYSGNRFMTSLGNVEATSLASFTFVNFETGAVLYLTGVAENVFGEDARRLMPMHSKNALTTLFVTGYTFVLDALPVRQTRGTRAEPSLYSPPIRFLAEEKAGLTLEKPNQMVLLSRIDLHSPTIATFWFKSPTPLTIKPGQAAILSFTGLLGQPRYAHMAESNPKSVNDDLVRTWTISASSTHEFALTMREIPRGVITGAIFNLSQLLVDTSVLDIHLGFIGISGSFSLPPPVTGSETKLLWIAGGIGITPFLSMLRALKEDDSGRRTDIHMILSTREPDVLVPLLMEAADISSDKVKFELDLFTTKSQASGLINAREHPKRVDYKFLQSVELERKIYLCGSKPFEKTILEGLAKCGVDSDQVTMESFSY